MNTHKLDKLYESIRKVVPLVVKEWNDVKINQFQLLFEKSFQDHYKNRQTQEKTKNVSPVIDTIFTRLMNEELPEFELDEGKGRDYKYGDIPLECKVTLSGGNSWTGNGYTKTDMHILFRFNINDEGIIDSYFTLVVDLSECDSTWTSPDTSSNFSSLKFLNCDKEKLNVIHGSVIERSKYLACEMVKS